MNKESNNVPSPHPPHRNMNFTVETIAANHPSQFDEIFYRNMEKTVKNKYVEQQRVKLPKSNFVIRKNKVAVSTVLDI